MKSTNIRDSGLRTGDTGTNRWSSKRGPGAAAATPSARVRRNPWPIAIVVYFIFFTAAMAVWVVYASHQRMDLVGRDYYAKEILFQDQIDATIRARQSVEVAVAYDSVRQSIRVQLPAAHKQANATGTIHFYRPNNASLDRDVQLALEADASQRVDAKSLASGLWKVRLSWRVDGQDYYFDQRLVIGGNS